MVELYKFFLGDKAIAEEEAISNFIVYCCEWLNKNEGELTEEQEKSFIESRVAVFQDMQKMVELYIDFFKRNCPRVTYDEGKFYLTSSGRNRVTFLIAKGFKYIPVEMSNQDYEKWCDLEFVKKIEENIPVFQKWIDNVFGNNPEVVKWAQSLDIEPGKIIDSVLGVLKNGVNNIVSSTVSITMGLLTTAMNVSIGFVFACYVLLQKGIDS